MWRRNGADYQIRLQLRKELMTLGSRPFARDEGLVELTMPRGRDRSHNSTASPKESPESKKGGLASGFGGTQISFSFSRAEIRDYWVRDAYRTMPDSGPSVEALGLVRRRSRREWENKENNKKPVRASSSVID